MASSLKVVPLPLLPSRMPATVRLVRLGLIRYRSYLNMFMADDDLCKISVWKDFKVVPFLSE